jgi:phospholipid/cholesterol/gamma-HCH transport system substrate-binding protein
MTERGATELKVGIGVGLGLLLLIITIFLLGGDRSFLSSTYSLKVPFDKIDGLAPGSVVRLSGFEVGNISSIGFSEKDSKLLVNLKIFKEYQNRITDKSIAGLRTQGALGDKYIYISPGEEGGTPLKDGDFLAVEQSSDLITTLTQRGQELSKVFDILQELSIFAKTLNKDGRSDKMMDNLVSASNHMDQAMHKFDLAISDLRGEDQKNLKRISKDLASILEKIDNGSGTLGGLINDPTIHEKIKGMLGGAKRNDYMKSVIQKTITDQKTIQEKKE